MADINLIILICTFVTAVGTLSDYLLRKKEKTALRMRLENAFRKINESRYSDLTLLMSEKMIGNFKYIFGEEKLSFHRFLVIATLSGFLTQLAINTAYIIKLFPSLQYQPIARSVFSLILIVAVALLGYRRIRSIFSPYMVSFLIGGMILGAFISIYVPNPITPTFDGIIISFRNGSINFVFDLLTLYITYQILILIRSSTFLKRVVYVATDAIIAYMLAAGAVLSISQADGLPTSYREALSILYNFYAGLKFNDESLVYIFFGSTTLVPTLACLIVLAIFITIKPIVAFVQITTSYFLESRLEDEDLHIFTVLGLMISVFTLFLKIIVELYKHQ